MMTAPSQQTLSIAAIFVLCGCIANAQEPQYGHAPQQIVSDDSLPLATHLAADLGCDGCTACASDCGIWGGLEYGYWWRSRRTAPLLVTTSPLTVASSDAGALDQNTSILFGGDEIGQAGRLGFRGTVGTWLDPCRSSGVGVSCFSLIDESSGYANSNSPIIARPFFNESTMAEDALVIAYPGERSGSIEVLSDAQLYGGDVFLRKSGGLLGCGAFDLIAGYRYSHIGEGLRISSQSTFLVDSGTIAQGTTVEMSDVFTTRNDFNGAVIGIIANVCGHSSSWEFTAKLGLGSMRHRAIIRGETITTAPLGLPAQSAAGLLAQPSNSGQFESHSFVVSPELGVKAKWRLSQSVSLTTEYSLIYWNNVLQVGDQIDSVVDPTQPVARPLFPMLRGGYMAHGLNIGLVCQF
jgi:hypothetical protein